jgi:hypothetical protein
VYRVSHLRGDFLLNLELDAIIDFEVHKVIELIHIVCSGEKLAKVVIHIFKEFVLVSELLIIVDK